MDQEDILFHNMQPDGPVVISTSRLQIKELVRKNAASVLNILSECPAVSIDLAVDRDPDIMGVFIANDLTDQYRFFGYGLWGIFINDSLIGLIGIKNGSEAGTGELSYALLKEYRRRKLMTEAALAVLQYAKEAGFQKICIRASSDNPASAAFFLALKAKYAKSGIHPAEVDSFSLTL